MIAKPEDEAIDVELHRIGTANGALDRHTEPPPVPLRHHLDALRVPLLESAPRRSWIARLLTRLRADVV